MLKTEQTKHEYSWKEGIRRKLIIYFFSLEINAFAISLCDVVRKFKNLKTL